MDARQLQDIAQAVEHYLDGELKTRIKRFLDRAEQTLLAESTSALPEERLHATRQALLWLEEYRWALEEVLHEQLLDGLADPPTACSDDAGWLTPAREQIVRSALEFTHDELLPLQARLTVLQHAGARLNPEAMAPAALLRNFVMVLADMDTPLPVTEKLLESYGETGVERLKDLYQGLNRVLAERGVLAGTCLDAAKSETQSQLIAAPLSALS